MKLTRPQRLALHRVYLRVVEAQKPSARKASYLAFRRTVVPYDAQCVLVPFAGMWLGVERDGYTHS